MILPQFSGERIKRLGDEIAMIAEDAIAGLGAGQTFRMRDLASQITLSVILRTVLGVRDEERFAQLSALIRELIDRSTMLLAAPFLRVNLGPWSPYGAFLRCREKVHASLLEQIESRKADTQRDRRADLLDLFLAAKDDEGNAMAAEELYGELLTLLLAGYETTSLGLTWAMYELLRHPEQYERLRNEANAAARGASIKGDDAEKMPYARAVFSEALRKYPVFFIHGRRILKPLRIAGHVLCAGTVVAPCPWLVHSDAQTWPEPMQFKPERFLNARPVPGAFFPFGGGVRRCAGAEFAMLEATLVLSVIARRFNLALVEPNEPMVRYGLEMMPKHGLPLRIVHQVGLPQSADLLAS
jgi:cytochrome P450 family 110